MYDKKYSHFFSEVDHGRKFNNVSQKWGAALKESIVDYLVVALVVGLTPVIIYGAYMLAFAYQHGCNFF